MDFNKKYMLILAGLVLLLGAGPAVSFSEVRNVDAELSRPVAEVSLGSGGIAFMPVVNYKQLALTVSSPSGEVVKKVFDASSSPYFELSSFQSRSYADGVYTYELRVYPFASNRLRTEGAPVTNLEPALTQSGHFRVLGGAIVIPGAGAGEGALRTQDIVHNDDVIITFSLCVGNDCVNGENFGFDTLRLKENNLRIHFDDTSASASFPKNDWRIVVNDSSNGGASYFSVEDSTAGRTPFKIVAGAPANSLYVNSSGHAGFGTSTPAVDLHAVNGNTPSLRLEQDGSSGFSPQTFDIAANETNFFVRDVSNGSKLPFRIQPGGSDNTLTLRADGNVGIGTWGPSEKLELQDNGNSVKVLLNRTDGAQAIFTAGGNQTHVGSKSNHEFRLMVNNAAVMTLNTDQTLTMSLGGGFNGTWNDASSRELKENIEALSPSEAMETLEGLTPVKYNYKTDKEEGHVGFIAEDVPDLVAVKDRRSLSPMDMVAVLAGVVKEQQKTIGELNQRLAKLENK